MDPDLFIRPDGRPILFLMSEANPERREVSKRNGSCLQPEFQTIISRATRLDAQLLSGGNKLTLYCQVKRLVEEAGGVVMADLPQETPQELLVTLFKTICVPPK